MTVRRAQILTEVMKNYFDEPMPLGPERLLGGLSVVSRPLPVVPKSSEGRWSTEVNPRRLTCTYEFRDPGSVANFLHELMVHEAETGHHAKITCEFPHVIVEVRTHDLDDVTELDQHYARVCSQIYDDVILYSAGDSHGEEDGW